MYTHRQARYTASEIRKQGDRHTSIFADHCIRENELINYMLRARGFRALRMWETLYISRVNEPE